MDEIDIEIVSSLQEDSRARMQRIAKRLKVSEGTIRNRVRQLEDGKVIMQYSVQLDPAKLGFRAAALIGIGVEPAQFFAVMQALAGMQDVRSMVSCTGEYPIIIEIWKKDANDMAEFLAAKLNKIPGITKISPNVIVERLKFGKGPVKPD